MKNLLKLLSFIPLFLVSTGFGGNKYFEIPSKNFKTQNISSKLDYTLTNRLKINNKKNSKFIVKKCEREAISDMYSELNNFPLEESWIFNENNQIWYEVGKYSKFIGDTLGRFVVSSKHYSRIEKNIIQETLNQQPNEIQSFIHYHIHPSEEIIKDSLQGIRRNPPSNLNEIEKMFDNRKELNKMYKETSKRIKEAFKGIKNARPSIADIRGMFNQEILELRMNPFIHTTHKICSQYGITEYHLTPNAINYFVKEENNFINSNQLKDYVLNKKENGEISLKNDYLSIHFVPYDALGSNNCNKEKAKH